MLFQPPTNIATRNHLRKSVFLAGSIEMGACEDWQTPLGEYLLEKEFNVFNPRRTDWDSSWIQSVENPQFFQQVSWELNALEKCNIIFMYLDPNTKSPISLLELGLHANSKKLHIVCPEGFYRKGNVDAICIAYNIPMYKSIEEFKQQIIK
jgi:hypothetical protein